MRGRCKPFRLKPIKNILGEFAAHIGGRFTASERSRVSRHAAGRLDRFRRIKTNELSNAGYVRAPFVVLAPKCDGLFSVMGTSKASLAWSRYLKLDAGDLLFIGEHNQVVSAGPIEHERRHRQPQFSAGSFVWITAFASARRSE